MSEYNLGTGVFTLKFLYNWIHSDVWTIYYIILKALHIAYIWVVEIVSVEFSIQIMFVSFLFFSDTSVLYLLHHSRCIHIFLPIWGQSLFSDHYYNVPQIIVQLLPTSDFLHLVWPTTRIKQISLWSDTFPAGYTMKDSGFYNWS